MKLSAFIDSHGRLFGKIHVFDAIILLCILGGAVLIIKNFFRSTSWVTVDMKVVSDGRWDNMDFIPPPNWLGNALRVGEKEFDWDASPRAEILDKRLYDAGYDRSFLYITVKLKSSYNAKSKSYSYKNKTLGVGSAVDLIFPAATVKGMIIELEPLQPKKYVVKKVTVELYDRRPWFADAIAEGDTASIGGVAVARVLSKIVKSAEKSTIVTDYNRSLEDNNRLSVTGLDPTRKDVRLVIELAVTEDSNGFLMYRDDQRVRVGNTLWIALPQLTLSGASVTRIE